MKKAIISGATGALGMALLRELTDNRIKVLVLGRKDSARNERLKQFPEIEFLDCPMNQYHALQNTTGETFDVFYHFAWEGTTGADRNDMYLQNQNVRYALDAVHLAKRFGCSMFIGSGSQAEYGRSDRDLTPETPAFPENGYGMAKLCAGSMTRMTAHQLGMRHVWTRILSLYGPYDTERSLIMSLIRAFQSDQVPSCTAGEQIWDYLYSADAAELFRKIGESSADGKTYIIAGGRGRKLSEYIKTVRDIISPETDIAFGAVPYGEKQVMYLAGDISGAEKDFDWHPVTSFETGIENIMKIYNNVS